LELQKNKALFAWLRRNEKTGLEDDLRQEQENGEAATTV
jgi:hypothetical protein